MNPEEQYKADLKANGVDLPEVTKDETPEQKADAEAKAKEEADAKAKADEEAAAKAKADDEAKDKLPDEPKEPRKRSIYDEYKEKKTELKSEKEAREKAEKERDELAEKLKALEDADTPEEKKEAKDELEAFAEEIKADPATLRRMQELFQKGLKVQGLSDEDRKILEDAKAFGTRNQVVVEKQLFEDEFSKTIPVLKELFPTGSDEDLELMKKELDVLSHKKEWHDKTLDYIAFKNKSTLSTLISPKKRGIEGKGKQDAPDSPTDFDPNADYSKMSPKDREAWEANYAKMMKTDGLATDSQGRKLLI